MNSADSVVWSVDASLKAIRVRDLAGKMIAKLPVTQPDLELACRIAALPRLEDFVREQARSGNNAAIDVATRYSIQY